MNIDIEQSILRKKIIIKKTTFEKINSLFDFYFWVFIMPVLSIFIIFYSNTINEKGIIFIIILNLPFIWNIIGLKYVDELTYLGEIELSNRTEYLNKIKVKCNYEIFQEETDLIIMKKSWRWFYNGKKLTIIFDKNKAYGNLTTLGKHDIRVPFFSFHNRMKLEKGKNYC